MGTLTCSRGFRFQDGPDEITIAEGENVDAEHPAVRANPDAFANDADYERIRYIRSQARNPRNCEAGSHFGEAKPDRQATGSPGESRDAAMRELTRHHDAGALTGEACNRAAAVIDGPDAPYGLDASYVAAHGSQAYERAFAKLLQHGDGAAMRMTQEEMGAVQAANRASENRAAMAESVGSTGGFGLPIATDPTINLSSNGAINPIRQLAEVRTMSTRELRLVTSEGVVAQYQLEGAEALDNSPTLAQPTLTASRATSFVPFSWEVGQDWQTLTAELAQLVADAKDVLEATKFLTGTGTNEPQGVLTGLGVAQRVQSGAAGAVSVADVYALKQSIGQSRFAASATWAMNSVRLDAVYRLTPSGSTTEPQLMASRTDGLLGRPTAEWSTMSTALTTGSKWALYGDWKAGYVIGDRLGMSVSLIQHLFGAAQRPTGQAGLYCFWRNDGRVKAANALRYGETL